MENAPTEHKNKVIPYLKYAIGEILLVVIGILIALYINNWNEARKDRKKEKAILTELNKDFAKNLAQFNRLKKVYFSSLEASLKFQYYISQPDVISVKDSIGKYYYAGFNGVSYNPYNGVVESLIASGEYQLITNDTLRNYLISWKDVLEDYLEEERYFSRLWPDKIEPLLIEEGDFTNLNNPKNFKLITTQKFRNLTERHVFLLKNVVTSIKKEPLDYYLNEIVRLSKVTNHE
jgi:hypothetical protein